MENESSEVMISRFKKILLQIIVLAIIFVLTIRTSCSIPTTTAYHENLPAYIPRWGIPESRFDYNRTFWNNYSQWLTNEYFNLSLRSGERLRNLAFEQGFISTIFRDNVIFGFQAGIGLTKPAITLRGYWLPFEVYGYHFDQVGFRFRANQWWQVSIIGGTSSYRIQGLGWALGGCVSKWGVGPILLAEFGSGVISLRSEFSVTFTAPWAPQSIYGQTYTIGIGAVHHGKI